MALTRKEKHSNLIGARFYTDDWGAYERHLEPENHIIGKANTKRLNEKI